MSDCPPASLGMLLILLAALPAAEPPELIDGFESEAVARWQGGEPAGEFVREGASALRWRPATTPRLRWQELPVDFGLAAGVRLQVHSAEASYAMLQWRFLTPDAPATDGPDGYLYQTPINWQGWRSLGPPLPEFQPLGRPAGWDRVEAIELTADLTEAQGETDLRLDALQILPLPAPERARVLAQRPPATPGLPTPLGDGRALVEGFGYGAEDRPDDWTSDYQPELETATYTRQSTWFGLDFALLGPGRLTLRRRYAMEVSDYWTLAVHGRVDGPAAVRIGATVDGLELPTVELDDGLAVLPLQGARLDEVRVEIVGEASGRRAGERVQTLRLEWIGVRERERILAHAYAFANRAVLLTWERPFWGAERYFVGRQRVPIAEDERAPAVAAGRSGLTPWLIDLPPEAGRWHYSVAPVEPTGLGLPSAAAATVATSPVPTVLFADFTVELDGDLGEWLPEVAGPPLALTAETGFVVGAPLSGDDDLSARIWLAVDGQSLLLAADVTDDVITQGATADGLELRLGAVRPVDGRYDPDDELVLNFTSSSGENEATASWSVAPHETGYRLEARIPLAALQAAGIDPTRDDWLAVGLSLFDRDTPSEEGERETILNWADPAGPRAALMRIRHYP